MEFIKIEDLIREDGTLQTWAGVGGYRLTFIDEFDAVICDDCAIKAHESDGSELISPDELKGAFIHWEGPALSCDECGADIPSEYGEADEEDEEEV